jgi:hypothetical protein
VLQSYRPDQAFGLDVATGRECGVL